LQTLLTHPGTQYAYALAAQLHRQGLLYRFATGLAYGDNLRGWLPARLQRRVVASVPDNRLYRLTLNELWALRHMRHGHMSLPVILERNRRFQQQIPQRLIEQSDAIIGFDTSSWLLADRAHAAGKPFLLDASIAHPLEKEAIYRQLRQEFPQWQQELEAKDPHSIKLEQQEMEKADRIVAATTFTKSTLVKHGVDPNKIIINPYGTDLTYFSSKWEEPTTDDRRTTNDDRLPTAATPPSTVNRQPSTITFSFLGILNARKGIPWLLRVWPALHASYPLIRLRLGGYGSLPPGYRLPEGVEVCGFIEPQQRQAFLHQADVFVFPSYFEGFAQVIIEAMACGLPVITTTPTVGPELITPRREGFIINPGDDEALLSALQYFIEHPHQLKSMGRAARQAVLPYTWEAYGERWKGILKGLG
jgi:glycosyltransferase involved in cell wall biosynthesis